MQAAHEAAALKNMTTLNKAGGVFGELDYVTAMTDVTGFGLLGHLKEICQGSRVNAVIEFDKVPLLEGLQSYLDEGAVPGGTGRNWDSYGRYIAPITERQKQILADPQTSGGLLIAVKNEATAVFEKLLQEEAVLAGLPVYKIGWLEARRHSGQDEQEAYIRVI